jgi:hypothetical protein
MKLLYSSQQIQQATQSAEYHYWASGYETNEAFPDSSCQIRHLYRHLRGTSLRVAVGPTSLSSTYRYQKSTKQPPDVVLPEPSGLSSLDAFAGCYECELHVVGMSFPLEAIHRRSRM